MFPDTPTRARSTHTFLYHSSLVNNSHQTLLEDIPEVPQAELRSLLDALLPPLPRNWRTIRQKVLSNMIEGQDGQTRWKCLPRRSPNKLQSDEAQAFRFVSQIFAGVQQASSRTTSLKCTVSGSTRPLSTRSNSSRPDAYLYRSDTPTAKKKLSKVDWPDIILPIEFKKSSGDGSQNDDFAKIIWSMHHMMRNDPRRRFGYGLTIENTQCRLWFNDRCGVVSSTAFDINKDWETLAHIMVAIIHASVDQLGYDLDMERIYSGGSQLEPQYDITVRNDENKSGPTIYRTVEMLSDIGANSMLGRGTRVWKVQKLVDGKPQGPFYALKDVWVHTDRRSEHTIIRELKEEHPDYAQYFLTVLDSGFVPAAPNDVRTFDNTTKTIRRGRRLIPSGPPLRLRSTWSNPSTPIASLNQPAVESNRVTPAGTRPSVGCPDDIEEPTQSGNRDSDHLNAFPRAHYRIVYEEIGTPVHQLRSYSDVFDAVEGGSEGLHAIHLSGQVHRDISSGNIMLVEHSLGSKPRGVVLDFEYVKNVKKPATSHDAEIGTRAFMAVEVDQSASILSPSDRRSRQPTLVDIPPFCHNGLHDLESIWWICMFMVFYLVHPEEPITRSHFSSFNDLFKATSEREFLWTSNQGWERYTRHLTKRHKLVKIMGEWSVELIEAYKQSYTNGKFHEIGLKTLEDARQMRKSMFVRLRKATKGYPEPLQTLSQLKTPRKRRLVMDCVLLDRPAKK